MSIRSIIFYHWLRGLRDEASSRLEVLSEIATTERKILGGVSNYVRRELSDEFTRYMVTRAAMWIYAGGRSDEEISSFGLSFTELSGQYHVAEANDDIAYREAILCVMQQKIDSGPPLGLQ